MNGLTLAKQYFSEYGLPMLRESFPGYEQRIAAGLVGEGSECFGLDDEISRDHDWGPSFCLWLTDADAEKIGSALSVAYANLPDAFLGFSKRKISEFGGGRTGVMPTSRFYWKYTGLKRAPSTFLEWRSISETYLAVVTNGEVFTDALGEFRNIRDELLAFYPEDIRIKKIVARAAIMAQSGQYNYARSVRRKEYVAAQCALYEFLKAAFSMVYLLNKKYMPFYKWAHRGIRALPVLTHTYVLFSAVCTDNCTRDAFAKREEIIEQICALVITELKHQRLTDAKSDFLHDHCASVMQRIKDSDIRLLHILAE